MGPRKPLTQLTQHQKIIFATGWAEQKGLTLPQKPGNWLLIAGIISLFAFLLPGLLLLFMDYLRRQSYRREMNDLILQWGKAWEVSRRREERDYVERRY